MFGVGVFEIVVILVVAVIFLGPDKLPQAIVDITKFLRAVKKTINDAKDTFDKEVQISELKKEALEYKKLFEDNVSAAKSGVDSLTKDLEFKELSNLSLHNLTDETTPAHSQKSAESRALESLNNESLNLESLNFQSAQIDAQLGISESSAPSEAKPPKQDSYQSPQSEPAPLERDSYQDSQNKPAPPHISDLTPTNAPKGA